MTKTDDDNVLQAASEILLLGKTSLMDRHYCDEIVMRLILRDSVDIRKRPNKDIIFTMIALLLICYEWDAIKFNALVSNFFVSVSNRHKFVQMCAVKLIMSSYRLIVRPNCYSLIFERIQHYTNASNTRFTLQNNVLNIPIFHDNHVSWMTDIDRIRRSIEMKTEWLMQFKKEFEKL